ncbi:Ferritin domain-containing protein, partial [Cephalotus follicularis]
MNAIGSFTLLELPVSIVVTMFLRSGSDLTLSTKNGAAGYHNLVNPLMGSSFSSLSLSSSMFLRFSRRKHGNGLVVFANRKTNSLTLTGVVFDPFEELKKDSLRVPVTLGVSLARQNYKDECEAAINEQINVEYNVSYVYHAMYAYFDRDNIALKGFAKFFKESSEEEREHAEKLMKYQ